MHLKLNKFLHQKARKIMHLFTVQKVSRETKLITKCDTKMFHVKQNNITLRDTKMFHVKQHNT